MFDLKIRRCKILDKYHVCHQPSPSSLSAFGNLSLKTFFLFPCPFLIAPDSPIIFHHGACIMLRQDDANLFHINTIFPHFISPTTIWSWSNSFRVEKQESSLEIETDCQELGKYNSEFLSNWAVHKFAFTPSVIIPQGRCTSVLFNIL